MASLFEKFQGTPAKTPTEPSGVTWKMAQMSSTVSDFMSSSLAKTTAPLEEKKDSESKKKLSAYVAAHQKKKEHHASLAAAEASEPGPSLSSRVTSFMSSKPKEPNDAPKAYITGAAPEGKRPSVSSRVASFMAYKPKDVAGEVVDAADGPASSGGGYAQTQQPKLQYP